MLGLRMHTYYAYLICRADLVTWRTIALQAFVHAKDLRKESATEMLFSRERLS